MNTEMKPKLLCISLMCLLFVLSCYASSLDNAQEIVDKYYSYSQEKNIEGYSSLFDKEYVTELYGDDYKEFFKEIFTYYDITEYELDFQYYTESEESLTLFYNLQAKTLVQGEKVNMDNDLVALFSKNDEELKLKYMILQETFIEQMNREVIYTSAIQSFVEDNSDLKKEAESKNIELVDYKSMFEDRINSHNGKLNFISIILILLGLSITLVILGIIFKEKIKNQKIREYIEKTEKISKHTGKLIKQKYIKTVPIVKHETKRFAKKTLEITKHTSKKIHKKIKQNMIK